jgi:hypothetical protein
LCVKFFWWWLFLKLLMPLQVGSEWSQKPHHGILIKILGVVR